MAEEPPAEESGRPPGGAAGRPGPQTVLSLKLTLRKPKAGPPDAPLQEYLRERLRLLENDDSKARSVLGELAARLLSIHSEDHLIVVTFWTFEEIWKFKTYYSLGFLSHCMENLLLDDSFWFSIQEEEEGAGIDVRLDEECLDRIYKDLLIQEGAFFVFHPETVVSEGTASEHGGRIYQLKWAEKPSQETEWDAFTAGLSKPLVPFHQWFLKANTDPADFAGEPQPVAADQPGSSYVAVGSSVAVVGYESAAPEEIGFQEGDRIDIIGYLLKSMKWFLGRHVPTGQIGFVPSAHVKPDNCERSQRLTLFEDEQSFLAAEKALSEEDLIKLLKQTSREDVCDVYQIDGQEDLEFEQSMEQGAPRSPLNGSSCPMKCKVEQLLRRAKDLPSSGEGRAEEEEEEEEEPFSAPAAKVPSLSPSPEPRFRVDRDNLCQPGAWDPLLLFLNRDGYEPGFRSLYDLSFSFLGTLFHGYAGEEDLMDYLGRAREAAKRARLPRALARLCCLLGRLSLRQLKWSQARVYLEEALAALRGDFGDLPLAAALYANLAGIYLAQRNPAKRAGVLDKAASLLAGVPGYVSSTAMEAEVLKHALKRAVLGRSRPAEARSCLLLAKHYLDLNRGEDALPFLERLRLLGQELGFPESDLPDGCFRLGRLYGQKCLPHLALGCVQSAASRSSGALPEALRSAALVLKNSPPTAGQRQMALYLRRAVSSLETGKLYGVVCGTLSALYSQHGLYRKAIDYAEKALDRDAQAGAEELGRRLVFLSWLYLLHGQSGVAAEILTAVIESSESSGWPLGAARNMLGLALKRLGDTKRAAESYYQALRVAQEAGRMRDRAVALANLGILCLHSGAGRLGERFLLKAVRAFSELPSGSWGRDFIEVLLRLGRCYASGAGKERARWCYEWAFLVAMKADHLEGQFQAVGHLCQFYSTVLPDQVQCVLYNEYRLSLLRKKPDKVMEGQVLETISRLYLSLGTERAYRSALEYTKRSLGLFIDLQAKAKEAQAWLQAGKIYYLLRQNELVDLYIQAAHNAAVCTQDSNLEMEIFEASGDIFFNGDWEKGKAVCFYRDKALPLAVKTRNRNAELRLCNKLVGLLLTLKAYEECLGFAQASLTLSVDLGMQLNERTAYHRLAVLHHRLGQSELAEHFYLKALSLCPSPLEYDEEALYYVQVYLVLGDLIFYELKDPFDAAGYYNLALAAAMELGNKKAQLKIYTRLAVIYHNFLVDREVSLSYYRKARTFATELNIRRINLAPDQHHRGAAAWALVKSVK